MTELTQAQQELLTLFCQKVKNSIKESKIECEPLTFKPIKKVVLEIDIEFVTDNSVYIPKEKLYEVVGKIVCGIE